MADWLGRKSRRPSDHSPSGSRADGAVVFDFFAPQFRLAAPRPQHYSLSGERGTFRQYRTLMSVPAIAPSNPGRDKTQSNPLPCTPLAAGFSCVLAIIFQRRARPAKAQRARRLCRPPERISLGQPLQLVVLRWRFPGWGALPCPSNSIQTKEVPPAEIAIVSDFSSAYGTTSSHRSCQVRDSRRSTCANACSSEHPTKRSLPACWSS